MRALQATHQAARGTDRGAARRISIAWSRNRRCRSSLTLGAVVRAVPDGRARAGRSRRGRPRAGREGQHRRTAGSRPALRHPLDPDAGDLRRGKGCCARRTKPADAIEHSSPGRSPRPPRHDKILRRARRRHAVSSADARYPFPYAPQCGARRRRRVVVVLSAAPRLATSPGQLAPKPSISKRRPSPACSSGWSRAGDVALAGRPVLDRITRSIGSGPRCTASSSSIPTRGRSRIASTPSARAGGSAGRCTASRS